MTVAGVLFKNNQPTVKSTKQNFQWNGNDDVNMRKKVNIELPYVQTYDNQLKYYCKMTPKEKFFTMQSTLKITS